MPDPQAEEAIDEEKVNRLLALWRARVNTLQDHEGSKEELIEFGWWFSSRRLPDSDALPMLHQGLELAGWVEPDHEVVETLAEVADTDPVTSVQCLALMVEGAKEPWSIGGWRDSAYRIITSGVKAGGHAEVLAVELANRLVARGYRAYEELLADRTD